MKILIASAVFLLDLTNRALTDPSELNDTGCCVNFTLDVAVFTDRSMVGADLTGASLEDSSFSAADLRGAGLAGAKLKGNGMRNARLDGAIRCNTVMPDGALSRETCN